MNKAILVGRLTRDPELRYTQSNVAYCKFAVAVDRRYKKGEEKSVDFINIVAWSATAEFIDKYFKKGRRIGIVGRIQVSKWKDDKGDNRTNVEVVADEVEFVDSKSDSDSYNDSYKSNNTAPATGGSETKSNEEADGFMPLDDDELPF
jgi:single-strand DNA-binding protein